MAGIVITICDQTAHLEFAFARGTSESQRPERVTNSYLFDLLDEVEAV